MVPEFVERTRGSKWLSALPTGNADQRFLGESRKTEDLGRSNLWRPKVVGRMRGSKWQSAQPTGSQWVQAQSAGASPSQRASG